MADLEFDPTLVIRGLIIDTEQGNLVKANRFGFVKKALHGTPALDFEEQREAYARTIVDLAEPRWVFLNTLFSLSEALPLRAARRPARRGAAARASWATRDLYERVRSSLDADAHGGRSSRRRSSPTPSAS